MTMRLAKLVKILKNEEYFIKYRRTILRLKFEITRIWYVEMDGIWEPIFCMDMSNGDMEYIVMEDLTESEIESIVIDLEKILID